MSTSAESELAEVKAAIVELATLLVATVEATARTGAFDQAGNQSVVAAQLGDVAKRLKALGSQNGDAIVGSAIARVENKAPHIKRLVEKD